MDMKGKLGVGVSVDDILRADSVNGVLNKLCEVSGSIQDIVVVTEIAGVVRVIGTNSLAKALGLLEIAKREVYDSYDYIIENEGNEDSQEESEV